MSMEMSVTLKQVYSRINHSFFNQCYWASPICTRPDAFPRAGDTVLIPFTKCHGAILNFVLFFQLVYTTFRTLMFGRWEGPRLWKYLVFTVFLFCFVFFYFNKLYKVCELNRINFLKNSPYIMALLSRSLYSVRQCFSKCHLWTSSISISWEVLAIEILRPHPDLLNLKLCAGWGPVICLFINLPSACESLRTSAEDR